MLEVGLIFIGMLGMMLLDTKSPNKSETESYDKDFFREELSANQYDNFMVDEVVYQMKNNHVKGEFDYLVRNGLSTERAVDELIRGGKIKF